MAFIGKFIRDLLKIDTAADDIGIEVQRKDSPTQTEFIEKQDFLKEVNQGLDDHIADIDDPHESMRVVESKPTGLWDGGELNIVNGTFIEVVAGAGMVIDSYTDPYSKPASTILRWQTFNEDIIGSDVAGSVVWMSLRPTTTPAFPNGFVPELIQRTTWLTPENLRDEVYLGVVLHNGDAWGEISSPIVVNNAAHTLDEFLNRVIGPTFVVEGGGFTESSNPAHNLDQAAGVIWELNRNWHINKKNPHRENIAGGLNMQFKYTNRDFTDVGLLTDTISADFWDNNGTVEAITGSGNRTTIQRLYLDPADNLWILWGQNVYDSFDLALALIGADTANTTVPALCQASVLMGYIVSESGKIDWDINESRYIAQNGISAPSGGAPPITDHALLTGLDVYPVHPALSVGFSPVANNPETDVQNAIEYNSNLLAAGITQFSAIITDNAGLGTEWDDLNNTDFTGHPYADVTVPTSLRIETTDLVNFYHKGVAYAWVGPKPVTVGIGGDYVASGPNIDLVPTGVGNHPDLSHRDANDSHPSAAITDLVPHYDDATIHANHTTISVNAGAGLDGGGTIAASRTINVGAGAGIQVNTDDVEVIRAGSGGDFGTQDNSARGDHIHDERYYTEAEVDAILLARELDDLADVTLDSLVDGQGLTYDATLGYWRNFASLEYLNITFFGYNIALAPVTSTPGPGLVSRNAQDVSQTTALYVNRFDASGAAVDEYWGEVAGGYQMGYWLAGDSSVRENYYVVDEGTLNGDIWTFPVAYIVHVGGDLLDLQGVRFLMRANPLDDYMRWKNVWDGREYVKGDTVYDEGWAMVANKQTSERPAPQPIGDASWLLDGPTWTDLQIEDSIRAGVRIIGPADQHWQAIGLRVWIPNVSEAVQYRFSAKDNITGEVTVGALFFGNVIESPGWFEVVTHPYWIEPGADIAFWVSAINTSNTTDFDFPWLYQGSSNQEVDPGAGNIMRRGDQAILRINKTDADGNPRPELDSIVIHTIIKVQAEATENRYYQYDVTAEKTDNGTWYSLPVTLMEEGANGAPTVGERCITFFKEPIHALLDYVEDLNAHIGQDAITGLLEIGQEGVTESENSYGVDVQVQEYTASVDWDLLSAPSDGAGSGGDGSGGTTIHNELIGRETNDAHPISAITDLVTELSEKSDIDHTHIGLLPDGGLTNQVMSKNSDSDADHGWNYIRADNGTF